jgi:hypothetical protein
MHDTVSAIVRAASLRPGKFELTASEQYLVNCANDEVRKADKACRRECAAMRATEYLISGGLFNPEMMEHDKVRELIIACREALLD